MRTKRAKRERTRGDEARILDELMWETCVLAHCPAPLVPIVLHSGCIWNSNEAATASHFHLSLLSPWVSPPLVLHSPSFSCFSSLLILQIFVFLIVSLCVSRLSSVSVSAFRTVHVIFCAVASSVCPIVSSSLSSSLSFLQRMYLSDPCICRSPAPFCLSFDLWKYYLNLSDSHTHTHTFFPELQWKFNQFFKSRGRIFNVC